MTSGETAEPESAVVDAESLTPAGAGRGQTKDEETEARGVGGLRSRGEVLN